jgi:hypothetical protein
LKSIPFDAPKHAEISFKTPFLHWFPNLWLFEIVLFFFPVRGCQGAASPQKPGQMSSATLAGCHGGQDWTRTSDPRLIKAVL